MAVKSRLLLLSRNFNHNLVFVRQYIGKKPGLVCLFLTEILTNAVIPMAGCILLQVFDFCIV
jgi:hypothetical protein